MAWCCFILPIPFVVALLALFATSALLPSGAPVLAVAAQSAPIACPPDHPMVNCLMDPCTTNTCALGCKADYCGGCNAHCVCRHSFDCASSGGGKCQLAAGERLGFCVRTAPEPMVDAAPRVAEDSLKTSVAPLLTQCRKWCGPGRTCRQGVCVSTCTNVRCGAGQHCEEGRCVAPSCSSNTDCTAENSYCSEDKSCLAQGYCNQPADCQQDPSFVHPMCLGDFTCESHKCGYKCAAAPEPQVSAAPLLSGLKSLAKSIATPLQQLTQCRGRCAPGHICRQGACVASCANVRCGWGMHCQEGRCVAPSCASNADCTAENSYCSEDKKCLAQGYCSQPADCQQDPSFVHPMCLGEFTCESHKCGYKCAA